MGVKYCSSSINMCVQPEDAAAAGEERECGCWDCAQPEDAAAAGEEGTG